MIGSTPTPFERLHPALTLGWFVVVLGLTMCLRQPVLIGCSLMCSLITLACTMGVDGFVRLRGMTLFALVLGLWNPFFSASGSTLLVQLGPVAIYAESLWYGLCSSGMLLASVSWFMVAQRCLSSSELFALFGRRASVLALMLSMCARLVPQILRRWQAIMQVKRLSSRPTTEKNTALQSAANTSGTLLGWALSDSLTASDSMRARGWGGAARRSSYRPYHWKPTDSKALFFGALLAFFAVALGVVAASQYQFYPVQSRLVVWWGYAVYAAFMLLAALSYAKAYLRWERV